MSLNVIIDAESEDTLIKEEAIKTLNIWLLMKLYTNTEDIKTDIIRMYSKPENRKQREGIIARYYHGVPKNKELICIVDYFMKLFAEMESMSVRGL